MKLFFVCEKTSNHCLFVLLSEPYTEARHVE